MRTILSALLVSAFLLSWRRYRHGAERPNDECRKASHQLE
jgi:hypothetical protein